MNNAAFVFLLEHEKVAELLIQKGADVNFGNVFDDTPLMFAGDRGKKYTAKLATRIQCVAEIERSYSEMEYLPIQ